LVSNTLELESEIKAIISDDKVVYVSLKDGRIVFFPIDQINIDSVKTLQEKDNA